ncbi:hypothetical protein V6R21_11170 [Limibacter armeniacum]
MKQYLEETPILDFSSEIIQQLILKKGWQKLSPAEKVKGIYNFVRDV